MRHDAISGAYYVSSWGGGSACLSLSPLPLRTRLCPPRQTPASHPSSAPSLTGPLSALGLLGCSFSFPEPQCSCLSPRLPLLLEPLGGVDSGDLPPSQKSTRTPRCPGWILHGAVVFLP